MPSTPFLGRFDFEKSCADLPKAFCNDCQHIKSETGCSRHVCRTKTKPATRPATIYGYPMCYLPHTVIASDLGSRNCVFQLQFNRFLTEDPSLAVFSVGQEAPVSDSWRDDGRRLGCGWSGLFSSKRSQCHAAATVGSYWPFGLSNRAVLYWNAEDKVILLDWSKLYSEYFAQARSPKNKRRIERIVQRYRDLDAENMRKDTDGRWSSYGDWDIYPATHSEIAMACRYEGPLSDFEDRLDPKKERFSAHEMMLRVGDRLVAVGEAIRKRVDGKPKMYEGEDKARADYSHGPVTLWKRASYHKLLYDTPRRL